MIFISNTKKSIDLFKNNLEHFIDKKENLIHLESLVETKWFMYFDLIYVYLFKLISPRHRIEKEGKKNIRQA